MRRSRARRWYRRRGVIWSAGIAVAMLGVLGLFAAVKLVRVAHDLQRARAMLDTAGKDVELGQLGPAREQLGQAQTLLSRANTNLYNDPSLQVLGVLPVVHDNLAALRDTVGLALRMTDGGSHILAITKPLESPSGKLEVPLEHGTIPLQAVQDAEVATRELAAVLPPAGTQPNGSLLAEPIAHAQRALYQQAGVRRAELDSVSHGLQLLAALSGEDGPKRYLIAVANPAEMRGSGGMILSYGVLESNNGTFTLGNFGNIDELFLDQAVDPASLSLPKDYLDRWGALEPTRLWRNATVNPDFTLDAPILEAMFSQKTGLAVDGVMQVDPAGLAAILVGTGPVDVPGLGRVDATNVVDLTINRAYIDVPNRDQRQELLGDVARGAFETLIGGELDSLRPLGDALYKATLARHIEVYTNDSRAEREVAYFRGAGDLPAGDTHDFALLTVQNFSKNKLDYYVDTSLRLAGSRPATKTGHVTATVVVANRAPPDGTASYVFGPNAPGERAGLYRGMVSLYLPVGVTLDGTGGDPVVSPPALTSENGRTVVTFEVEALPGEQRTVTLALSFAPRPKGAYRLDLVPVGRVRPTSVAVDLDLGDGTRATRPALPLDAPVVVAGAR